MANPYSAPGADMSRMANESTTYYPKVFELNGRIGRLRYMAFSLVMGLLTYVVFAILFGIGTAVGGVAAGFVMMIIGYLPLLAVTFILARRRLHDLDKSGWLSLLLIIPLVNLVMALYLIFAPGSDSNNQYGPAPSANPTWVLICGMAMPVIAVLGIVAAIALPAYQSYVMRAQAAQLEAEQAEQEEQAEQTEQADYSSP